MPSHADVLEVLAGPLSFLVMVYLADDVVQRS
jgi:hypothetical protein